MGLNALNLYLTIFVRVRKLAIFAYICESLDQKSSYRISIFWAKIFIVLLDYGIEQTVKFPDGSEKKINFKGQMDRPTPAPSGVSWYLNDPYGSDPGIAPY